MLHRTLAVVAILAAATACTSARKRAEENLTAGNFEEAAAQYETLVARNPKDPELVSKLSSARDGVLNKRLIAVRMARMSGNAEGALAQLLDIVATENRWKHYPKAQVGFTQSEEVEYALPFFDSRLKQSLHAKAPLQAEDWHRHFAPVFQAGGAAPKHAAAGRAIAKAGAESCKAFRDKADRGHPYFAEFVNRYCAHFGVDGKELKGEADARLGELYSRIDATTEIAQLPAELRPAFQAGLQDGLQETPWYEAAGKKTASFKLTGTYRIEHKQDLVNRIHDYTVTETYYEYEPRPRVRRVSDQGTEQRLNPVTKIVDTVPATLYRDETYTEQERVARQRQLPKVYQYNAMRHQQSIELAVAGEGQVGPQRISLDVQSKDSREGYQHDLDVKEVGLTPSRPDLHEPATWVRTRIGDLRTQLRTRLSDLWTSLYCKPTGESSESLAASGEQAHRCLRSKPAQPPAFVEEWYMRQLGLGYARATELLAEAR